MDKDTRGLALGHSNQYIQRRLNDDSGTGANAGSRADMTFVAPGPLSELVWSPQNGLSLKCADSSFANRKPSLVWDAGPSNVILLTPQDKPIDEENLMKAQAAFHLKSEIGAGDYLAKSPRSDAGIMPLCGSSHEQRKGTSDYVEEMNMAVGASVLDINQKQDLRDSKGYDICGGPTNTQPAELSEARENNLSSFPEEPKFDAAPSEPSSRDTVGRTRDVGSGNQTSRMEIVLASEVRPTNECKAYDTSVQNLAFPSAIREESASIMEKESKSKMKETGSLSVPPLEKLESTAENDLQTLLGETACGAARKIVASESDHEVKKSFWQDEEILRSVSDKHSPTNSRIQRYRRKGKAKALCDGDFNAKMSNAEDDDSHESVESCNSAGLFSTGKKRWDFDQQLIVGSKRVKKHSEESPGSTSFMKQDSSFMNWIANMTKGFFKSNQDEAPALALTLPYHSEHESPDQKLITCNANQDPRCRNMGFQSLFQSLYCPKTKVQETRMLDDNYQAELDLATPIACHRENENFCKQFLLSNENFNESTSGNGANLATQPTILPVNFAASQENSKGHSAPVENKTSFNLATGKEKDGRSSNSSLGKRKKGTAENIDSDPPSEGKTTHNINYRCDLGSLWITRFTPKTSGPSSNWDHCNRNTSAALECSTDCMRLIPCSQDHVDVCNNLKIVEVKQCSTEDPLNVLHKELQNCAVDNEASIGFNRIKGNNEQNSMNKLNPFLPTPRVKNSEAMASVFARRLDALKHITPSEVTENAACVTITCFYCGRKGHHLRDCSEITDTELEDLLKNRNSYNWMEDLHCFCIRCFQLNHWAVACPNASSKGRHQSGCGASLVNDCSPSEMQLNARDDEIPKLLDGVENKFQAAGTSTVCDGNDPKVETSLNLNWKLNETKTSDKLRSNASSVRKFIASSPGENKLSENQITPLCIDVSRQISDVPKGIFDAMKRLRLTRTDILKWMDSRMSISHLDGFFLRLRLGKWEEGLGGTGYYVACITGAQRESSQQKSKNSISVTVGGIKCLVGSQYISNHDFLEDELMAWWSATAKSSGKIPSEENLRLKLKERKMLGI